MAPGIRLLDRAFHPCNISTRETNDRGTIPMKAIVVTDQAAGTAGMKLVERPEPQGAALASLSG